MPALAPGSARPSAPAVPAIPRQQIPAPEIEARTIQLDQIDNDEVKPCTKCGLSATRTKTAFGVGSPAARIAFIGEAPGHDEDMSGIPFVGRAGQLLTKMIEAGMGLKRADVYICNILKCRPPNNRNPFPTEVLACEERGKNTKGKKGGLGVFWYENPYR